jgi:hypothetical protein
VPFGESKSLGIECKSDAEIVLGRFLQAHLVRLSMFKMVLMAAMMAVYTGITNDALE